MTFPTENSAKPGVEEGATQKHGNTLEVPVQSASAQNRTNATVPVTPVKLAKTHSLPPKTVGNTVLTAAQERRLQKYQHMFLKKRQTPYMDYPAHVHLETLALCTAACNFCPYPGLERKGAKMSDALLDKIIEDLTDMPKNLPFQLSPFKVNEPFLDPRLFDLLDVIHHKLPQAVVTLTSNGSVLTEEKLHRLSQFPHVGYLWMSVNDHRPKNYTETMRLPWEKTFRTLETVHRMKSEGKLSFHVVLSRVGDGTQADLDFGEWVRKTFPLFQFSVFQRGNWLGQAQHAIQAEIPDVGCSRWFDLSITATGTVAHCCMDGQAQWPLGDVSQQHVLEVYNQPEYRKLREQTLTRLDVEPCHQCAFL